ncbi:MAG: polyribonucleotide nucleotidyltransferase [Actinomycetota bacterium]|nr:polyribonucleotide nucleotidyltransferase [Actinomycetota bacterium]MDD5667140.1 polyribonucleotide nucleotidyltransferase [Actinomycetota bacterium]
MTEEEVKKYSVEIAGKLTGFEVGKLAILADGAAVVSCGGTDILVTAMGSKHEVDRDFFPLVVDVEERMYAAGKIPGGFFRREGRPSEKSILNARLIDRPLRPTFPEGMRIEVQVIATILSVDQMNPPDVMAINGASAALSISDIPFNGPVGAVRVGLMPDGFTLNPTLQELENSRLDLVVAGVLNQETNEIEVIMVEAGAMQVPEDEMVDALEFSKQGIREMIKVQQQMMREIGKEKRSVNLKSYDFDAVRERFPELQNRVEQLVRETARNQLNKPERDRGMDNLQSELVLAAEMEGAGADFVESIKEYFSHLVGEYTRRMIVEEDMRIDGRRPEEIRPITCEVGLISRTHGSGLFRRGLTQVLTLLTLGPISDMQKIDDLSPDESKRYLHHYNFPPFSVGETGMLRGPRRREIGHGALAERALVNLIPDEEDFPYTVRLVSEVLSSNGSTSMASVCASTLALMDAGVPMKDNKAVAGIAMGLIKEEDKVAVLTDIQGFEDKYGDMDFKVAGTDTGITALQMDMKVQGISVETLQRALAQAREARLYILRKISEALPQPRGELSPYAPRVVTFEVPVDKIREVIGPGGKVIHKIMAEHDVELDIEDDGRVFITAKDLESAQGARRMVEQIIREAKAGEQYDGTVTRTTSFGAFVEILPGKEGLIHISKLADRHIPRVEDVINVGDKVKVEVTEIDKMGRINLRPLDLKIPDDLPDTGPPPRNDRRPDGRRDSRQQPRSQSGPGQGRQDGRERDRGDQNRPRQDRKNW